MSKFEEGSPEHIGALLEEVTNKVPKLVSELVKSIYSAEAGSNFGKATGNLYKELIAAGIPQEEAIKMAKDYMLSISTIMKNANINGQKDSSGNEEK
jgi:hypothetical protein